MDNFAEAVRSGNYGDLTGIPIARLVDAQTFLCTAIQNSLQLVSAHMWPVSPAGGAHDLWTEPARPRPGGVSP